MSGGIELVALQCLRCAAPIPAAPDEVAWVCATCGQGLLLDEDKGVAQLDVHFARASQEGSATWLPFWVTSGTVHIASRQTYGDNRGADELWAEPRMFVLPAFDCSLEEAGTWGTSFLRRPPSLAPGPAGRLQRVTVDPAGAQALAQFVVLTVEAERRDHLKAVTFVVDLEAPDLWVLPFADSAGALRLALAS